MPTRLRRAIDAWLDRSGDGSATLILLLIFVAAWTVYHVISNASVGVHPDLAEIYAWSRHPSPGYYKHPPLGALIGAAWFAVFPAADWSFRLLAMANAAAGLYFVDLIARRYLDGDKRLLVLLLLLLTPFYQFLSERFASNQTLLSTWPFAVYCFLRAYETRALHWSAAAGFAAALAMLGKYYSIYLIGGLIIAALAHPARWAYLKSPSPWISITVGVLVLAPHLYWLQATGFQPFVYAFDVHGGTPYFLVFTKSAEYVAGALAYVALPVATYLIIVRPDRQTLKEALWPQDADRRILVVLLAAPLLLPVLLAPVLRVRIVSLWTMQAWFLLPIVLLAPANVHLPRAAARRAGFLVLLMTIVCLLAAPLVALAFHRIGTKEGRADYRGVGEALTREWHATVGRPMTIVIGGVDLAEGVAFYSPDHPDAVPFGSLRLAPWVTPERLRREGWAIACRIQDTACVSHARQLLAMNPSGRAVEIETARSFLGIPGMPSRFLLSIVPPGARWSYSSRDNSKPA
jgi:4-amino-4-deoxy-L-arabinose transferase-like glycosyltransferase